MNGLSTEDLADIIDDGTDYIDKYGWRHGEEGYHPIQELSKDYEAACLVGGLRYGIVQYILRQDPHALDGFTTEYVLSSVPGQEHWCELFNNIYHLWKHVVDVVDMAVLNSSGQSCVTFNDSRIGNFTSIEELTQKEEAAAQEVKDFMRKTAKELRA